MLVTFEELFLLDIGKEKEHYKHVQEDCEADVPCKWAALTNKLLFISLANRTVIFAVTDLSGIDGLINKRFINRRFLCKL